MSEFWRARGPNLIAVLAFCAIAAVQITATFENTNHWPVSSYNMFNENIPALRRSLRVAFFDSSGNRYWTSGRYALPIEFFRADPLLHRLFLSGSLPADSRELVASSILERINHRGWRGFDETFASLRPPEDRTFTGFEIHLAPRFISPSNPQREPVFLPGVEVFRFNGTEKSRAEQGGL